MDVSDQGKERVVFVAKDGFIPVLKEVPCSPVLTIEVLCVPGEKLSHDCRDALLSAPKQEVNMVVHKDPGVDDALRFLDVFFETLKKSVLILGIAKNVCLFNSPDHDVM
jgi:hypothetical protein